METINTNVRPYYDDFSADSKYYRILFKPGLAVQARELTQIQSAIQNQIERIGKHLFVNGAKIIDANQFFESNLFSIRLEQQFNSININLNNLLNKRVVGQTSGAVGIVKEVISFVDIDNPHKIMVQLVSGSSFVATEELWTDEDTPYKVTIKANGTQQAITESLRYSISSGVFFINGFFVYTEAQSIVLDSDGNTSSHSVGFDIVESFVTADEDTDLLDPANGSSNYAAPGADRLAIELILTKKPLNSQNDNYIEIAKIENGKLTFEVTKTIYAEIEKELARRTFDESGSYVVEPFSLTLINHFTSAKATATIVSGSIVAITPNASGIKFTAVPTVTITGNGTGATATVVLDNNPSSNTFQEISSITVTNGGTGYTEAVIQISGDPNKFMCALDPGKSYIKGFEFTTIAPSYLETEKPRTTELADNIDVSVNYSNLIYVENVNTLFNPNIFQTVDLHKVLRNVSNSESKIGTAQIRMNKLVSGIPGSGTETYKLSLFNIEVDKKPLSSVTWLAGIATFTSTNHNFVSGQRISINDNNYGGTFTVLASPPVTADNFSVAYSDNPGALSATATAQNLLEDLESITTQGTQNGGNVSLLSKTGGSSGADVFFTGTDSNSLVFPLNNTWIKTIRDSNNSAQTDYTYQSVYQSINFSNGTATISTISGLERFFGGSGTLSDTIKDQYYIVVVTDPGTSGFVVGQVLRFNNAASRSITLTVPGAGLSQQATFNVNANVNFTANILATINANTQTEKTKSLQNYTFVIITSPNTTVGGSDSLGIADIKNLKYVYNTGNQNPSGQIAINPTTGEVTNWGSLTIHDNVTSSYKLDNGQRDNIYDHGSIILQNSTTTEQTDYLVAVFNYYTHTGTGFISVDSYSNEDYASIPVYISPTNGLRYELRDCIDFRPRRDNNATSFSGIKYPDADFTLNTDYQYYLPRIDRIFALSEKAFSLNKGVPNLHPLPPPVGGDESLLLYTLVIPPYLTDLSDVHVYYHDNRRYTMNDIGDLEKRIRNLEYYASLTLLEQQARAASIPDSNNFEKFKNGFFVDPFVGHFIGAIGKYNYRCSIDSEKQELRAFVETEQLDFSVVEKSNTVSGNDRLTLSYTETAFLTQTKASTSMSVNPYNIVTYIGDLTPVPATDSWVETQYLPAVLNTVNVVNPQTVVVNALKESTVDKVTNVIKSAPTPSDSQKHYLANGEKSGLTSWVYDPKTEVVASNKGDVIKNVNSTVVNNFLGRK